MSRCAYVAIIAAAGASLAPSTAEAQRLRGEGTYYRYGYAFTPWQATPYSGVEFRTKCEGEQVRGSGTGPIKWMVEFRNGRKEIVHFDYRIGPLDQSKPVGAQGRADIKARKMMSRLVTISTTRCDEGVVTVIGNVRFGPDINGTPFAEPDQEFGGS